ncbi:hypothetical protein [Methylosinus sp. PW1]|uniref:hypothetical protein n=1 Tax=Methylosinus sp. PW1 TaxID=107636 RepID=UPI00055F1C9B|nr:hypothetical protein [Methylosinus sp. PW1]
MSKTISWKSKARALAREATKGLEKRIVDGIVDGIETELAQEHGELNGALRVDYDPPQECLPEGLPAPRLQLRWEHTGSEPYNRICYYELVLPIGKDDIRRSDGKEDESGFCVIDLGASRSDSERAFETTPLEWLDPYRNGCHAIWDSEALGFIPIFLIAPDGKWVQYAPEYWNKKAATKGSPFAAPSSKFDPLSRTSEDDRLSRIVWWLKEKREHWHRDLVRYRGDPLTEILGLLDDPDGKNAGVVRMAFEAGVATGSYSQADALFHEIERLRVLGKGVDSQ